MTSPPVGSAALRSALVAAILACLISSLIGAVHLWFPEWDAIRAMVPATILGAVACLLQHSETDRSGFRMERLMRLAVFVVAVIAAFQLWQDLLFAQVPLNDGWPVLDHETWSYTATSLGAAWAGKMIGARLSVLEAFGGTGAPPQSPVRWLAKVALIGGAFAVGLTAIQDSALTTALNAPFTDSSPSPLILLLYAVSSVLLVALARHNTLRARWLSGSVSVNRGIPKIWATWTLALTLAMTPVAVLLPSQPSVDPSAVRSAADPILSASQDTLVAARGPAEWFISRIGGTFRVKHVPPTLPTVLPNGRILAHLPPGMHLPRKHHGHKSAAGKGGHGAGGVAMAAGFWLAVLLILGAIAVRWWRAVQPRRRWGGLLQAFRNLVRLVRVPAFHPRRGKFLDEDAANDVEMGPVGDKDGTASASRALIVRYYERFLQAAARAGATRHGHVTPTEFGQQMRGRVPTAATDIEGLTGAFVHARYAPDAPGPGMVKTARDYWESIDRALRHAIQDFPERASQRSGESNPQGRADSYADEG